MRTFIVLGSFTDQGRRAIKNSPKRLDAARKVLERIGGKLAGFYLTMGPHDFVAVIQAKNDELVVKYVLALAARGDVKTTTLKAFPEDEYRELIAGTD
jgi:uncharacterized protein with GYD domain